MKKEENIERVTFVTLTTTWSLFHRDFHDRRPDDAAPIYRIVEAPFYSFERVAKIFAPIASYVHRFASSSVRWPWRRVAGAVRRGCGKAADTNLHCAGCGLIDQQRADAAERRLREVASQRLNIALISE